MKNLIISLAAVALSTAAFAGGPVMAPVEIETYTPWTGAYVGGAIVAEQTYLDGYGSWFDETWDSTTKTGIQVNAGYTAFNNGQFMLSVEGRLGASETSDIVETSWVALYAKPAVQLGDFNAYVLAGYGTVDFTTSYDYNYGYTDYLISQTASVSDWTVGIGGEYSFTPQVSVFFDYVALPVFTVVDVDYYEEDLRSDVMSLGINYRF